MTGLLIGGKVMAENAIVHKNFVAMEVLSAINLEVALKFYAFPMQI